VTRNKSGFISLREFLPHTQDGLVQFAEDHECEGVLDGGIEGWAFLWFRLREAEDKPEWFPAGKWATIQRIECLLIAEAKP